MNHCLAKQRNSEGYRGNDKKCLTSIARPVKLLKHCFGEVSEWFKELVLKTSDSERGRGFESHLLRYTEIPLWEFCECSILYSGKNKYFFEFSYAWRSTQEAEGAPLERE